ncbi:7208_t:CDS:2 [Diversispora eburnea]|uniref:7208_t:CDS:1 n=1 Tax=Diversispora eburnea TaxID=1213867 RepID=A0A9N8V534_9GLOM|nr:7208_t:CDS:2 [Diversispora eburnea]
MSSNDTTTEEPTPVPSGDVAWLLASTALVWLMVPGVGYFYSGMARSKNALSLIMLSVMSIAVVSIQWWLFGFSLAFSPSGNKYIGDFKYAFFRGVDATPLSELDEPMASVTVPVIVFAIYQCMFAAITPALAIGAAAERGRILPAVVFIFIWTTVVYDPIACWTWNVNGWSYKLGGLDFAGGTPVHISSGAAALAYCLVLGKRHGHAGMACVVTNLAASVGGLTWVLLDFRLERKLSTLGFCSGAVAGLVAITPGSGFVGTPAAVAFGFCGALCCNFAVKLKHVFDFDDAVDVFAVHGVGGIVGNLLTGIFAQKSIIGLDGTTGIEGGWLEGNWIQFGYQLADSVAGLAYSFFVTLIILLIMDKIPGLSLRIDPESEAKGLDETELGELAYYHIDRLVAVNTKTGDTRIVKEETIHQQNDTSVAIM